uniref:Peptidase A1 domain-containing protein n=1 Tax=Quercus lobata TaxID=97700 RepID=A0A7N2N7M5_QUELO
MKRNFNMGGANALYKPTKDNILPSKDSLCMEVQRYQAAGYCQSCQQCDYEIQYADQSSTVGVPMLNGLSMDFYHSEIMKMNYGSRRLRLGVPDSSVGPVIFDSGSSYTYFLQQAYSDLVASLEEVSGLGLIQDTSDLTLLICWKAESPISTLLSLT